MKRETEEQGGNLEIKKQYNLRKQITHICSVPKKCTTTFFESAV